MLREAYSQIALRFELKMKSFSLGQSIFSETSDLSRMILGDADFSRIQNTLPQLLDISESDRLRLLSVIQKDVMFLVQRNLSGYFLSLSIEELTKKEDIVEQIKKVKTVNINVTDSNVSSMR